MTLMEGYSVAELHLTAAPTLGGYAKDFDGVTLREVTDMAIVSLAIPLGGEAKAEAALKSAFGVELPAVGASVIGTDNARLVRLGVDQAFVLFPCDTPDAEPQIARRLRGAVYTTDQTDVWVAMEVSGALARTVLERVCPLDLCESAFAIDQSARTSMEHMGTIITRTGNDTFLLLSASSSARSFLHMLETSVFNVS